MTSTTIEHDETIRTISGKSRERNWLDLQVAQFKARGGEIKEIGYGVCAEPIGKPVQTLNSAMNTGRDIDVEAAKEAILRRNSVNMAAREMHVCVHRLRRALKAEGIDADSMVVRKAREAV